MRFETHRFNTNCFVSHGLKHMRHKVSCRYSVRHKDDSAKQAVLQVTMKNKAEIRRPYSALFGQNTEVYGKETHYERKKRQIRARSHKSFERARNRSYYRTME